MPLTRRSGIWFAVRELGLAAVCVVPALWGRLNHWLPLRAALTLGRATSRNPDDPDMHTLVGGLLLVLVAYAGIVVLIGRKAGWGWAVLYLASLPPAASLDFWWRDRLGRSLARARGYLALRRSPSLASWLAAERQVLRQEAERLSNLVERAG
jgi:MFS family permease